MAIIQGSNNPLVIQFDQDVSGFPQFVVTLWKTKTSEYDLVKQWNKAAMTIDGDTVTLPLTEAETRAMPAGLLQVEAKGLGTGGNTLFWAEMSIDVVFRRDKTIVLGGSSNA